MRDPRKAWEGSQIRSVIVVTCSCGTAAESSGLDIELEALRRKLSVRGWRFNDAGDHCLCPKCGPKRYPELYSVSQRDSTRVVRRVGEKAGKSDKEEVRHPRRVRGR